jgi:uncharacterized protein (UPF0333 family)
MEDYVGKSCPFCKTKFERDEEIVTCPDCYSLQHKKCWEQKHSCTVCSSSKPFSSFQAETSAILCVKCGKPLTQGQLYCPNCGEPKGQELHETLPMHCLNCGADIEEGFSFCPRCGGKISQVAPELLLDKDGYNLGKLKRKRRRGLLFAVIAVIVAAIFVGGYLAYPAVWRNIQATGEKTAAEASEAQGESQKAIYQAAVKADPAYMSDVTKFAKLMDDSSGNLKEMISQTENNWDEAVTKANGGLAGFAAMTTPPKPDNNSVMKAENAKLQIDALYNSLYNKMETSHLDQLNPFFDSVDALYGSYCELYQSAVNPYGTYSDFRDNLPKNDVSFSSAYNDLIKLLN